jgi:hypothetical protein
LRDLSGVILHITPENLSRFVLEKLAAISPAEAPAGGWHAGTGRADRGCREIRRDRSQLAQRSERACVLPKDSRKSDLEVELGIVVGPPGNIVGRTARDTGFRRRRYGAI